jgi:hypothetical protein
MTIVDEIREVGERAKQTKAVERYLLEHGHISNHMAIYQGVPGYGIITRLGARIYDLRERGYLIRTEKRLGKTHYFLEATPGGQLPLGV